MILWYNSKGGTVSRTEEAIKGKVDALNSTIVSFWHSMKYGWNIRNSNFNKESAIWFLGRSVFLPYLVMQIYLFLINFFCYADAITTKLPLFHQWKRRQLNLRI